MANTACLSLTVLLFVNPRVPEWIWSGLGGNNVTFVSAERVWHRFKKQLWSVFRCEAFASPGVERLLITVQLPRSKELPGAWPCESLCRGAVSPQGAAPAHRVFALIHQAPRKTRWVPGREARRHRPGAGEPGRRALRPEVCASPRPVPPGSTLAAQARWPRRSPARWWGGTREGEAAAVAAAAPRGRGGSGRAERSSVPPLSPSPAAPSRRPGSRASLPPSLPPPCSRS